MYIMKTSEIVEKFISEITPQQKASLLKYDMATLKESIRVFKLVESFQELEAKIQNQHRETKTQRKV